MKSKLKQFIVCIFSLMLIFNSLSLSHVQTVYADDVANNENAKKLYAYILGKGGTDWWASAAVGNAYAEHGLETDISGSGYWGAFQFQNRKEDFKSWCSSNGRDTEDICAQYDWFGEEYRGSMIKALTGLTLSEIEKDTTYIKDAKSAAAFFALGMEGCVCYSGITNGVGSINDSAHDMSRCAIFTFPNEYGDVCLQDLTKRTDVTTTAYNAFSGKIAPADSSNGKSGTDGNNPDSTNIQVGSLTACYYSEDQLSSFIKLHEENVQSAYLDNATRDNLNQSDLSNLANWEDNVTNSKKEYGFIAIMRIIVMWIGIIFTVYILLLYLAYWFDRINSIIDLDVLSILTFGKLHVAFDEKEANFSLGKKQDRMTVRHRDILFICITGLIFGTLLITGTFYKLVAGLVNTILSKLE